MKRLLAVFTLCATTLIAASAVSGPAAADGRHDGRRHAGQSDRQTSRFFADRGTQRRAFRDQRDRRHHKFRRYQKQPRHAHRYRYRHRHGYGFGYGYGFPRHGSGYRMGPAYALRLDGARIIFRFD
jgi:hypothetical protein